jgi:hypothetical protein
MRQISGKALAMTSQIATSAIALMRLILLRIMLPENNSFELLGPMQYLISG